MSRIREILQELNQAAVNLTRSTVGVQPERRYIALNQLDTLIVDVAGQTLKSKLVEQGIKNQNKLAAYSKDYSIDQTAENAFGVDRSLQKSLLGTPVFDNLIILEKNFVNYTGLNIDSIFKLNLDVDFEFVRIPNIILNNVICSVVRDNKVVINDTLAGDTVKEFVNNKVDYRVDIVGQIAADGMEYDFETIGNLVKLSEMRESFEIESVFLNLLGITQLVILSIGFAQIEGHNGILEFRMNCVSDATQKQT